MTRTTQRFVINLSRARSCSRPDHDSTAQLFANLTGACRSRIIICPFLKITLENYSRFFYQFKSNQSQLQHAIRSSMWTLWSGGPATQYVIPSLPAYRGFCDADALFFDFRLLKQSSRVITFAKIPVNCHSFIIIILRVAAFYR